MTWTSRKVITTSSSLLLGPFTPLRTVLNMELSALQNLHNGNLPGNLSSTILLVTRDPWATKFLQDTAATPLDGISTVGGVWTFVNGTFLLFFGANFMYFAFGRRPLSALGIAHLLQRRTLNRQWHEDFPALQTEGGQPGSASAGIVAFIRERLVDVEPISDDTGNQIIDGDVDSQATLDHSCSELQTSVAMTSPTVGDRDGCLNPVYSEVYSEGSVYRLDEIPLMNMEGELGPQAGKAEPGTTLET
ncbi:hypothetical protein DFH06DRAFT_1244048 [Mycena polygramma]|nr:hypothetical protein DFH06DRAFT_1244048 [Mycena polygramma]